MAILGGNIDTNTDDTDDFSPSSTVVPFDPPIPLLRGPIPAAASDDPTAGAFVLAFDGAASWRSAFGATQSKLVDQCLAGARVGCAINASNKCKPPWWKSLFGDAAMDYLERERCEERELASCLEASKDSCLQFAKDKCLSPFRDARIGLTKWNGATHLVFSSPHNAAGEREGETVESDPECSPEVTYCKGSSILENSSSGATCSM